MPKTPATPKKPPTPVVPAGGSIFATAGGGQTGADAVGALSGPWFIKVQSLGLNYQRVPIRGPLNSDASSFSLSAQSESYFVGHTKLAWRYFAEVHTYKDFNNYATSTYFQPQKFTLYPQVVDSNSNIYDDPVGYQLGPKGDVYTTQAAITRVEWDDNNYDHIVSSTVSTGWTFANAVYDEGGWTWNNAWCGQGLSRFKNFWCDPEEGGSYQPSQGFGSVSTREWYSADWQNWINGPYQVNAEVSTLHNLQTPVDGLAAMIRVPAPGTFPDGSRPVKGFFLDAHQMGSTRNGLSTLPSMQDDDYWQYHPSAVERYDWTLHDWS